MRGLRFAGTLLGLVLAAAPVWGGEAPYRLADINRAPESGATPFVASGVAGFSVLGDRLLFSTALDADNTALWSTDGTPRGTSQLSSSLCAVGCGGVEPLATWHGVAFLSVLVDNDGFYYDHRLARSDGTPAGTFLLSVRHLAAESIRGWESQGGDDAPFFFFRGCRPLQSCQLWRSDGTAEGTQIVRDADGQGFEGPDAAVLWRGRIWFAARHGDRSGLWSTDGTPEGTRYVHDIVDDGEDGPYIEVTKDHLFFATGDRGEDLWTTDGTPEGTRRLADFEPVESGGGSFAWVNTMRAVGDELYFFERRAGHNVEIWRSDGTESGTGPRIELPPEAGAPEMFKVGDSWLLTVYDGEGFSRFWTLDSSFTRALPLSGCEGGACPHIRSLTRLGPRTLFVRGEDPEHGTEPWVTDGTGPGTRRLADICPGACDGMDPTLIVADVFVSPSGEAWFQGLPAGWGREKDELWATDGTPAGTRRVWNHFTQVGFLDGRAYFGSQRVSTGAVDLWSADGPSGAIRRVRTLRRFAPGSYPDFQAVRDGVLMTASAGRGRLALWKSDGTPERTVPFFESPDDGSRWSASFLAPAGKVQILWVFHADQDGAGEEEIWSTDGTRDGTRRLYRLLPHEYVGGWTSWAGRSLFEIQTLQSSCSLWSTDGTAEGTRKILFPLPGVGCPGAMTGFGSKLLFVSRTADTVGQGIQIFASDGTPEGTHRLSDLRHYREADFHGQFVQAGGLVFFRLFHDFTTELWRTDGTLEGTRPIFPELDAPDDLAVFRGSLYFTAQIPGSPENRSLYRAPLRGGEPALLARVGHGLIYGAQLFHLEAQLTPAGDRLVFQAMDVWHGIEPWVTDGTREGTHRLADLVPGPEGSFADGFASGGGKVFFRARDRTGGEELWETDGSAEGTRPVRDLAPGGTSASPRDLTVSNGFLFFSADDGRTGVEPWALRVEP